MKIEAVLVYLTATFFLIYGVLFALYPGHFAALVTQSVPSTGSGLIDMRATYGGLSVAVGVLMILLASHRQTLKFGLLSMIVVLLAMASTRLLGLLIDGEANNLMYVYLAAESLPSLFAIVLYQRMYNVD